MKFPHEHTTLGATFPKIEVKLRQLDVAAQLMEFSQWGITDGLELQPCSSEKTPSSRARMIFVADA
ncbi:MAG: hypothetical protein ACR65T_03415 [Methylocystis sp.]|uniref:hypothetical protein n=1 Tax=Methylocystis sp. TaxID=1911079 RepID=UPI003DA280A1